jgi:hypothetical protein
MSSGGGDKTRMMIMIMLIDASDDDCGHVNSDDTEVSDSNIGDCIAAADDVNDGGDDDSIK